MQKLTDVIDGYVQTFVSILKGQPKRGWIFLLDGTSTKTAVVYRKWINEDRQCIHLCFVPAGFIGIAQPDSTNTELTFWFWFLMVIPGGRLGLTFRFLVNVGNGFFSQLPFACYLVRVDGSSADSLRFFCCDQVLVLMLGFLVSSLVQFSCPYQL